MIDRRRAIKQIAPMIFVIQNARGTDYFVSTDDFALKVRFILYHFRHHKFLGPWKLWRCFTLSYCSSLCIVY